jgi:FKBP-type peptidyl-prolyl cis-trans isomerase SlyD
MAAEAIGFKKHVEVTYQITDDTGEIVERIDIPVKYVHGNNSGLFPKVEMALEGCVAGDEIEVVLSQFEGFGPIDPNLSFTDDLNNVPEEFRAIGAEVEMQNDNGEAKKFIVSKIENGQLTVDGNHPLAGKSITFNLTVASVRDATDGELKHGVTQSFSAESGIPTSGQIH